MSSKLSQLQKKFDESVEKKDEKFNMISIKLEAVEKERDELIEAGNFFSFIFSQKFKLQNKSKHFCETFIKCIFTVLNRITDINKCKKALRIKHVIFQLFKVLNILFPDVFVTSWNNFHYLLGTTNIFIYLY